MKQKLKKEIKANKNKIKNPERINKNKVKDVICVVRIDEGLNKILEAKAKEFNINKSMIHRIALKDFLNNKKELKNYKKLFSIFNKINT